MSDPFRLAWPRAASGGRRSDRRRWLVDDERLDLSSGRSSSGLVDEPIVVDLDDEAAEMFRAWRASIEPRRRVDGDLACLGGGGRGQSGGRGPRYGPLMRG